MKNNKEYDLVIFLSKTLYSVKPFTLSKKTQNQHKF